MAEINPSTAHTFFFQRYICIRVNTLNIAKKKATLFSVIYVNRRKEDDMFIQRPKKFNHGSLCSSF